MYSAENGVVNDFHLVHYATRALANYLALWFYDWYDKQKVLRDKIINEPQNSNYYFIQLKALFVITPLETKISQGANIYNERKEKIDELCIKAQRVIINPLSGINSEKIKVGFINSEEVSKLGISMTGSNLLKRFNYDVAIMIAITTEETITYSLRSDKERLDVDLTLFINNLVKAGVAVSGGGHKNAAGITFAKLPNNENNFFKPFEN
jgi:single-stranded DNA-specific DHH superfamily exonuclease